MPADEQEASASDRRICQFVNEAKALKHFATYTGPTQSQQHIKPLHWYVACRLVLEGGFRPEEIKPRPPFKIVKKGGAQQLVYDPAQAGGGEQTVLGGLKTKNVDVVVSKPRVGPVLAVSCKGMTGALRNLTNRMEETIGECTNLHITYPALVFGYLFVIRGNREVEGAVGATADETASPTRQLEANDIALRAGGDPVEGILRFDAALRELTGRRGIRNDVSRYEAIALMMVEAGNHDPGKRLTVYPKGDSPLHIDKFFQSLYHRYDDRFVFSAPDLKSETQRLEWAPTSPIFQASRPGPFQISIPGQGATALGFQPRISEG